MTEAGDFLKTMDMLHDPENVPDFSTLPDDTYQARLDKIFLSKSKKMQTWQLVMDWEIINGPYAFRHVMKYCRMEKEQSLNFLTQDLRKLGLEHFVWSGLEPLLPSLLDKIAEIKLVSKDKDGKTYQSIYIQKIIDMNAAMEVQRSDVNDEDIPF